MILFFGIVGALGFILVLLDIAAYLNDPTPSQYSHSAAGWGLLTMIVSGIGAGYVWATS